MYYVIVRGYINSYGFGVTTNLQVQRLDFVFDKTDIRAKKNENKAYNMVDVYTLKPVWRVSKLLTVRKEFDVIPFKDATRVVIWNKKEEKETHKGHEKYDKTFIEYHE
jgi:hypothetical protein